MLGNHTWLVAAILGNAASGFHSCSYALGLEVTNAHSSASNALGKTCHVAPCDKPPLLLNTKEWDYLTYSNFGRQARLGHRHPSLGHPTDGAFSGMDVFWASSLFWLDSFSCLAKEWKADMPNLADDPEDIGHFFFFLNVRNSWKFRTQ